MTLDLMLINPGGREKIYQDLGGDLTAIEPPLWCRLIAGYVLDRGFSVEILDSEAENMGVAAVAAAVARDRSRTGRSTYARVGPAAGAVTGGASR